MIQDHAIGHHHPEHLLLRDANVRILHNEQVDQILCMGKRRTIEQIHCDLAIHVPGKQVVACLLDLGRVPRQGMNKAALAFAEFSKHLAAGASHVHDQSALHAGTVKGFMAACHHRRMKEQQHIQQTVKIYTF